MEIFYTVEGDKIINKKLNSIYFHNESFKVNGEELFIGGIGSAKYDEEGKVYVGSSNYLINSGNMLPTNYKGDIIEVPDEFILTLEINEISLVENGSIKGDWNFDIPVSNEKLKNGVSEIDINADLSSIQEGLILEDVILTPINTAILGRTDYDGYNFLDYLIIDDKGINADLSSIQEGLILEDVILTPINTAILGRTDYDGYNFLDYLIIDDKGRTLENKASAYRNENTESRYGNIFMRRYKEIYEDTESIKIIPNIHVISNPPSDYEESPNDIKWEAPQEIKVPLNLDGETIIKTKYGEEYGTITKVEVKDNKTLVYYKPTIGNYDNLKMIVEDENELNISYPVDDYYRNEESTTKYNAETGEFVIEFHKALVEGKYSITYLDNSRNDIYLFDKAIKVDVK